MNSIFKRHNFDVIVSGLDALPIFRFNSKSHLKYKTFITEQMLKKDIWQLIQFTYLQLTLIKY